jgi:hypothetical protein
LLGSSDSARYGVAVRAWNLRACVTARLVSSAPVIPAGKAEVVLDPARRARLPAERRALDHECLEPLGGAVDRRTETGGAAADDEQVDLLARRELEPDAERAGDLAGRRAAQLDPAGQPHERAETVDVLVVPGERQPVAPCKIDHPHRRLGRARADDLEADAVRPLQELSPRHERREHEVAERLVFEQQQAERVAVDCEVAQRLRDDGVDEDRLSREEVDLAEEPGGAVADELIAGGVEDRHLALEYRDERVAAITHLVEHVADVRSAFLSKLRERRQLRPGEQGTLAVSSHRPSLACEVCSADPVDDDFEARGIQPRCDANAADLLDRALGAEVPRVDEEDDVTHVAKRVTQHQGLQLAIEGAAPARADEERPADLDLAFDRVVAVVAGHADELAGRPVEDDEGFP